MSELKKILIQVSIAMLCLIAFTFTVGFGVNAFCHKIRPQPTIIKSKYSIKQVNQMNKEQLIKNDSNNRFARKTAYWIGRYINQGRRRYGLRPLRVNVANQKIADIRNPIAYDAYLNDNNSSKYHKHVKGESSLDDWVHGIDKHNDMTNIARRLKLNTYSNDGCGENAGSVNMNSNPISFPGFSERYQVKAPKQVAYATIDSELYHDGKPEDSHYDTIFNHHNGHRLNILDSKFKQVGIAVYYERGVTEQHQREDLLTNVEEFN